MRYVALLLCLAAFILPVLSNVEKVIFLPPSAIRLPSHHQSILEELHLETLSPTLPSLRRSLATSFLKTDSLRSTESWFLLGDLVQNRRYEVRLCWAATVCRTLYFTGLGFVFLCLRVIFLALFTIVFR